jgi:hypothetical protein
MFASTAVHTQLTVAGFVFDSTTAKYFFKAEPVWTRAERIASGKRQGAFPSQTLDEFKFQADAFVAKLKQAAKAKKIAPVATEEAPAAEEDEAAAAKAARKAEKAKRKAEEVAEAEATEAEEPPKKKKKKEAEPEVPEEEEEKPKKKKKKSE